jgi:ribosomal protein S18 acetylase RimI-like enzyme
MSALKNRYIQDRMDSNMMNRDAATSFTSRQWESILADGKTTQDHYFSHFRNKDKSNVGWSWIYVDKALQNAFVFEFYLDSQFRGQGLAKPALAALEVFARAKGATTLGLNVFARNSVAKSLYLSYGFREVSTDMIKPI